MNPAIRLKLSIMMFLQYAIWGAWAVPMGAYCSQTLGFSGVQIGAIYATTAIAAMISPLYVGFLADRMFATERMIAALHLIGAILLGVASQLTDFQPLRAVMLVYALCYMPTLALTNSISFANVTNSEKEFPGIRVWGTWGWIVVGWVVGFLLSSGTNAPIMLSAGLSFALAAFSLVLPHTPPKMRGGASVAETSEENREGVLRLLRDPTFLVFVVCSFLICIPLTFYYGFANLFLEQIDAPVPTALQTIGQLSEVGFMALMPMAIARLGVKKMLAVGMLAWVVRYFCFGTLNLPLVVIGLILHGICYDFFFVASQIYVDGRTSVLQRASAQSFLAFVTLGLGMFVGNYVAGETVDRYPAAVLVPVTVEPPPADGAKPQRLPLPAWDPKGETGIAKVLGLTAQSELSPDQITEDYVEEDAKAKTKTIFRRDDLAAAARRADTNGDGKVSRPEWRRSQSFDWFHIWLWPALGAAATCVLFWIGFRAPKATPRL